MLGSNRAHTNRFNFFLGSFRCHVLVLPACPCAVVLTCCSSEGKFVQAVAKYSQAIDLHPTAIYLSNRALCYVKLENFGLAILDADLALA